MAPRKATWVTARHADDDEEASSSSSSSSSESEGEEEEQQPVAAPSGSRQAGGTATSQQPKREENRRPEIKIKLGQGALQCHVCGKAGHTAGFVGAKYMDCPNKPCYLCGTSGHSTMTCPYRVAPGHGCSAAAGTAGHGMLASVHKRERDGRLRPVALPPRRWAIGGAVLKLHERRATCLEFHPLHDHLVLSGDKKGQIAVWDWDKVYERTVYRQGSINRWLTNALRFLPGGERCATASYDGTVKVFDPETGSHQTLVDANPAGWGSVEAEDAAGRWVTFIGMGVIPSGPGVVVAGDSQGGLTFLDPRAAAPVAVIPALHKKKSKVQSVDVSPVDSHLLLTAGGDHTTRLLDARMLLSGASAPADASASKPAPAELAMHQHGKVVSSAYFSPRTGRKVLATCQDNRIRIWDYLHLFGQGPDREIVHSHNFNRYLTAFRAEWDPKDPNERLVVCGRYISEDFGGVALHPVDLLDAGTGALVGELVDPNLSTISPVNKPHPRADVIVSGSSRSLYAWHALPEEEDEGEDGLRAGPSSRAPPSSGLPRGGLRGYADYVCFDADDDAKKKAKRGSDEGAQARTVDLGEAGKKKGRRRKGDSDGDD